MCEHKWEPWKIVDRKALGDECGNFDDDQPVNIMEERTCELCSRKETRQVLLGRSFASPCDAFTA